MKTDFEQMTTEEALARIHRSDVRFALMVGIAAAIGLVVTAYMLAKALI